MSILHEDQNIAALQLLHVFDLIARKEYDVSQCITFSVHFDGL